MQCLSFKHLLVVSVALCCIIISVVNAESTCPPAEFIEPCTCKMNTQGSKEPIPYFYCANIRNPSILDNIFENNPNMHFGRLQINNSSMLYIPASVIEKANFEKLYLLDSSFTTLFNKPPSSKSLKNFETENVLLQRGVEWDLFQNLEINRIFLEKTSMRTLRKSSLSKLPKSVKTLNILHSQLKAIQEKALVDATNLEYVDFSHGHLKTLPKEVFPESIVRITLDYNEIETLPDGIFENLGNLNEVSLKGNKFATVRKEVFTGLRSVFLDENPIRCDCKIKWILEGSPDQRVYLNEATCKEPSNLSRKLLRNLKDKHFSYCG